MSEYASHNADGLGTPEDLLSKTVDDLLEDPILPRMVNDAKHFEHRMNVEDIDQDERARIVRYLDGQWPYMQQPVTIAGKLWVEEAERSGFTPKEYSALEVISNGFDVMTDAISIDGESVAPYYRMCYFVFIDMGNGTRTRALAPIDDSTIVQLPFASRDLRERRVRYLYPEELEEIDSCMFDVDREDQVIKALGDYRVNVDFTSESDTEKRDDLVEYIRTQACIETELPYFISLRGPILVPDGAGMAAPHYQDQVIKGLATVHDIVIRPEDVHAVADGEHVCTPYIVIRLHVEERDIAPRELLVPCSSVQTIESVRYLSPPESNGSETIDS